MSAPPPPGPGTRAYNGASNVSDLPVGKLPPRGENPTPESDSAPRAAIGDLFAAAVGQWAAQQPYTRPGSHLFLNAEQWESYDAWLELCAEQDRKYGHFQSVAALARVIR